MQCAPGLQGSIGVSTSKASLVTCSDLEDQLHDKELNLAELFPFPEGEGGGGTETNTTQALLAVSVVATY